MGQRLCFPPYLTVKPLGSAATVIQRYAMLSQSYKSMLGISAVQHPGCLFFFFPREDDPLTEYTARSWGQALAPDTKQRAQRSRLYETGQSHSLAKVTHRPGHLLHQHSSANRARRAVFASLLRQTADDKMEEQTDGTKAGINWRHLRCVLKQMRWMPIVYIHFLVLPARLREAESRRRLPLK